MLEADIQPPPAHVIHIPFTASQWGKIDGLDVTWAGMGDSIIFPDPEPVTISIPGSVDGEPDAPSADTVPSALQSIEIQDQTYLLCRYDTDIDEQNEEEYHKTFLRGEKVTTYRVIPDTRSCGEVGQEVAKISFVIGTDGRIGEPPADGMFPGNLIDQSWFDTSASGGKTFREQDFVDTIVKPMIHTTESVRRKFQAAGLDFPNVPIYVADISNVNKYAQTIWLDSDPDHLCVAGNDVFIELSRRYLRNAQTVTGQELLDRAADADRTAIGGLAHELVHAKTGKDDMPSRGEEPAANWARFTELDSSPYRRTEIDEVLKATIAKAFFTEHNISMLFQGDQLGYPMWADIAYLSRVNGIDNYAQFLARRRAVALAHPEYCDGSDFNVDLLPWMFPKLRFPHALIGSLARSVQETGSDYDDLFSPRRQIKDGFIQNIQPGETVHLEPGDFFFLRYTPSGDPDSHDTLVGLGIEAGTIDATGSEQPIPIGANVRTLVGRGRESLEFVVLNPTDQPIDLTMRTLTRDEYSVTLLPSLSH